MVRIAKYVSYKGFKIEPSQMMAATIRASKEIAQLTSWKELEDSIGGFYGKVFGLRENITDQEFTVDKAIEVLTSGDFEVNLIELSSPWEDLKNPQIIADISYSKPVFVMRDSDIVYFIEGDDEDGFKKSGVVPDEIIDFIKDNIVDLSEEMCYTYRSVISNLDADQLIGKTYHQMRNELSQWSGKNKFLIESKHHVGSYNFQTGNIINVIPVTDEVLKCDKYRFVGYFNKFFFKKKQMT